MLRATGVSRGPYGQTDLDRLIWLWPRMWHINQRNATLEKCPFICGHWFSGLKGEHRGDIILSDFPQRLPNQTELYVWMTEQEHWPASEPTNTMNIPWFWLISSRAVSCMIRKTMGHYTWVIRAYLYQQKQHWGRPSGVNALLRSLNCLKCFLVLARSRRNNGSMLVGSKHLCLLA